MSVHKWQFMTIRLKQYNSWITWYYVTPSYFEHMFSSLGAGGGGVPPCQGQIDQQFGSDPQETVPFIWNKTIEYGHTIGRDSLLNRWMFSLGAFILCYYYLSSNNLNIAQYDIPSPSTWHVFPQLDYWSGSMFSCHWPKKLSLLQCCRI